MTILPAHLVNTFHCPISHQYLVHHTVWLCTVYNLTNGIDVDETRYRVEQYKKENQALIVKNRDKQVHNLT